MLRMRWHPLLGQLRALVSDSRREATCWAASHTLAHSLSSAEAPGALTTTLLVKCPDQRGIAAGLAQILQDHDCNITRVRLSVQTVYVAKQFMLPLPLHKLSCSRSLYVYDCLCSISVSFWRRTAC